MMREIQIRRTYYDGDTVPMDRWRWEAAGREGYTITRRGAVRAGRWAIRTLDKARASRSTEHYTP